jgi:hypothetical protein
MNSTDERLRKPEATAEPESDHGFLHRWSGRKQQARAAAEPPPAEPPAPHDPPTATAATPPQEHTDADMPPLESLDEHSDYRGFLSPKVSEELRRSALRKLFRQARFNVCDGLDDYAEDFTSFQPLGDVVTQEMRRLLERERVKLAERLEVDQQAETPSGDAQLAETAQGEDAGVAEPAEDRAPRRDSHPGGSESHG